MGPMGCHGPCGPQGSMDPTGADGPYDLGFPRSWTAPLTVRGTRDTSNSRDFVPRSRNGLIFLDPLGPVGLMGPYGTHGLHGSHGPMYEHSLVWAPWALARQLVTSPSGWSVLHISASGKVTILEKEGTVETDSPRAPPGEAQMFVSSHSVTLGL